jgi:hypothetical protein
MTPFAADRFYQFNVGGIIRIERYCADRSCCVDVFGFNGHFHSPRQIAYFFPSLVFRSRHLPKRILLTSGPSQLPFLDRQEP